MRIRRSIRAHSGVQPDVVVVVDLCGLNICTLLSNSTYQRLSVLQLRIRNGETDERMELT